MQTKTVASFGSNGQVTFVLGAPIGSYYDTQGVETQEQLSALKTLNCDLAQGYLWSRPVDADKLTGLLADVTLVKGELSKVVEAIRLSRATFRKIIENLFWAWFYNLAAIPIAALGLLHPMIGVIAMTQFRLIRVTNAMPVKVFPDHLAYNLRRRHVL